MSKSEKFGLFASSIGFIVDVGTLLSFTFGFIKLSPSLSLLANPFVLAILTYFSSMLFIGSLLYYLIQKAKTGWKRRKKIPRSHLSSGYEGLDELCILLWLPTEAIWAIGMIKYFFVYFFGSVSLKQLFLDADFGFVLFATFAFMIGLFAMFPGFQLPSIAKSLDDFFDPKE